MLLSKTLRSGARAFSSTAAASAPIPVGINGFGRIGRLVLRAAMADPAVDVVAIVSALRPISETNLANGRRKRLWAELRRYGPACLAGHAWLSTGPKAASALDESTGV
jgi:hypothetical protein